MSVELVLSEILGVPCGNVKFTRKSSSEWVGYQPTGEPMKEGYYTHGIVRCSISFTTLKRLDFILDPRFGNVYLSSEVRQNLKEWEYTAVLLYGEETKMIAKAIYDDLNV